MSSIQRKAGTTFDFVQDYANQPIIMNSSEPVSSLPDPTMLEISGALLAPDGTGLMQTQNSQDELSSVLSQLGLPESYVTNQLNSNSAGLSYLQSLNPEILGVIQNPSDEAIRAEFVDAHYDGEMKETDKLNPAKLSAQCNSYTEKLNQENLSLNALYTAFYNASAVDLEGKTAGAFLEQCENYCIIIECLQMANYCDIEDNTKLYNKLGYIYLDGEVIIPGRIEAIDNWNKCIENRNTCNYLAGITDDDDDRDRLHSEAGYWQRTADSYYAEWERLTKLKEEFEEVNAYTKGLYKGNAPQLRSCAYQGMQLVGYAFKAGEYTMQSGVDEWKKSALQLKDKGLEKIAADKWKNEDGTWNIDYICDEISSDEHMSNIECMAFCYVLNDKNFSDDINNMEKLVQAGYRVEFTEGSDSGDYDGTWKIKTNENIRNITYIYGQYLDGKGVFNPSSTEEANKYAAEYNTYSLLYAGISILPDEGITYEGNRYDNSAELYDGHQMFELSLESKTLTSDKVNEAGGKVLSINVYIPFEDTYTQENYAACIMDYNAFENSIDAFTDTKTEEEITQIEIESGKNVSTTAITTATGFIPVAGQLIGIETALISMCEANNAAEAEIQEKTAMLSLDTMEKDFTAANVHGTIIITANHNVIIPVSYVGEDTLTKFSNYSNVPHDYTYNRETFMYNYMNDIKDPGKDDSYREWYSKYINKVATHK